MGVKWNDVTSEIIEKYREQEAELIEKLKSGGVHPDAELIKKLKSNRDLCKLSLLSVAIRIYPR